MEEVDKLSPPGRFLEKVEHEEKYVIVSEKRAVEKTCQLLREKKVKKPKGMDPLSKHEQIIINPCSRKSKVKATIANNSDSEDEWVPGGKSVKVKTASHRSVKSKIASKIKKFSNKQVDSIDDKPSECKSTGVKPIKKLPITVSSAKFSKRMVSKGKKTMTKPKVSTKATKAVTAAGHSSKATAKLPVTLSSTKLSKGRGVEKTMTKPKASTKATKAAAAGHSFKVKAKITHGKYNKDLYQRTFKSNPRRSLRRIMAESALAFVQAKYNKDPSREDTVEAEAPPSEAPPSEKSDRTVSETKQTEIVETHQVTPTSDPTLEFFQAGPVMAFEEDDDCLLPDFEAEEDTKSMVLLSATEFLRTLKSHPGDDGIAFGHDDDEEKEDEFDKEIEGITPPPPPSFPLRGVSSLSFYSGFATVTDPKERGSPSGVTDIPVPMTALAKHNSLFMEEMEPSWYHPGGSVSKEIFEKDSTDYFTTTKRKLW